MKFKTLLAGALGGILMAGAVGPAQAIALLGGMGGPAGFGQLAMTANDDGSSNQLNLPFSVNFFGNTYNTFFINNNGNLTFNGPVRTFTPIPFPVANQPMIAPYWGDVDTRGTGAVYVGGGTDASGNDFVAATWNNVGFYRARTSPTNNFQVILRERPDTDAPGNPGNFDIDFRYDRLDWTTGEASGGDANGLGGTEAQAGFDAGDNTNFFTLPGSQSPAVLNLENTSNVSIATPGLWTFAIRNGGLPPGSTPSNPLLPVVTPAGEFDFDFNVQLDQQIFIDPPVAIAYEYFVDAGPSVASVLIPGALPNGDSEFLLELFDPVTDALVASLALIAGIQQDLLGFNINGFRHFRISGIDPAEGLDPTDTAAFVTGLTFVAAGNVRMRQVPESIEVPAAVPEPGTLLLLAGGLAGLAARRRTRRA